MNDVNVQLTLTVAQVNQVLAIISKQPLDQVIDLFTSIKAQGDRALAGMQLVQGLGAATAKAGEDGPVAEDN